MTLETFLIKLGGVAFHLLLLFGYLAVRFFTKGTRYVSPATSLEYDALRNGDVDVKELIEGIWSVNIAKVTSYASFGLGTVVLAAVFIYEQKLSGYDGAFFVILLSFVSVSMLSYFLSIQLWFCAVDICGSINSKIEYRKQATTFQSIGWYAIHISILLAILAVSTVTGYIFSVINMFAAVYLMELKAIISIREQHDKAGKNEFQKSLYIDTIYQKNDDVKLDEFIKNQIRILNWNIERGYKPDQLVNYIKSIDPDIVALQELDWGNERTNGIDVLEYIAHKTGMKGYFGIEFFEISSPYRDKRTSGGGVHGNAILTKIKPMAVYRQELPNLYDWENPPPGSEKFAKNEKRIGTRFSICADFQIEGSTLTVCSSHLEDKVGGVDGRLNQFMQLRQALEGQANEEHIQVLAGDMNTMDNWLARMLGIAKKKYAKEKPWWITECRWWKTHVLPNTAYQDPFGCKTWTYKKTFLYHQKLDWILVKNADIINKGIGDFNSSDHRPLWIDLTLKGKQL